MNITLSSAKFTANEGMKQNVRMTFQASLNKKSTLREMHGKTYLFLDSDVSVIFDELLKLKIIDLHEVKCEKMMTYIIARIITLGVTLLKNDFPSRIE